MQRQIVDDARHGSRAAFEELASRVIDRLRDPDRFDGWLHRVLVHRCLDLARGRRLTSELPDDLVDPMSLEVRASERDVVWRGLQRLKPRERAALMLRYYLDLTVPQIAEVLRVPLGTAKSRLHAAEASMRAALDPDSRLAVGRGVA